ncbi:MAG: hypothetical protein J7L15_08720 [Clostridiales bacterium]|nr:hypothetical protein [Clostridiales bacterium]
MYDIKEEIRNKWFKDHVADFSTYIDENGNKIERLFWHKPDTWCFHINYTIEENTLIITGDLGCAIYKWSSPISFNSISTFNFDYFAGKCEASENGRHFVEWDSEIAIKSIEENFQQMAKDKYEECICEDECTCEERRAKEYMEKFKEERGDGALCDKYEWVEWVREYGEDILGYDCWEWAYSCGETIAIRCLSHLIGIQEAMSKKKIDI